MPIILMDLDGVICDNSHRAHLAPPESERHINKAWHKFVAACVDDTPIPAGVMMFKALNQLYPITIITSRQQQFATPTIRWFEQCVGSNGNMLFRPDDMTLPPAEYKRWRLKNLIRNGYEIAFAVDDDPAVVAMYQDEGVPTYQPSTFCSSLSGGDK